MSKTKTIDKIGGPVTMDKTMHIYQLDKSNGKITKANLVETGKGIYKLIEFDGCMYMPARSLEIAKANFNMIFISAKTGMIKLSRKEWIAKWLTVLTIKWNRLCRR